MAENQDQKLQENPADPGGGLAAYVEADAGGGAGGIDLSGLGLSPAPGPSLMGRETPLPDAGIANLNLSPPDTDPQSAPSAPESNPDAAAPAAAAGAKTTRSGKILSAAGGFFRGIGSLWRRIPPLGDIFDKLLSSLGLRRNPASMLRRAGILAQKGRLAEAISFYRELLALRPLMVAAYDGLGRVYFRMGLTEEADREFTIADCLERLLHNRDDIDAAAHLAQAFLEKKQPKISISMIEPVLVAHFYTPGNNSLFKAMGRVYTEVRALQKAVQVYGAGLLQYPDDYEFYILKGQIDVKMGQVADGEHLVRWGRLMQRLKENPHDAAAKMAMGEICLKEQKQDEGLKHLREAAVLSPDNTGIRWRLFNLYQKMGDYENSQKYFLEVVALEPENEDLQYRLAEFYRKQGHREEAVKILETLKDRHPRDPKPPTLLGDVYSELGQFEESQKMKELGITLEGGLKQNPDHRDTVRFMKYLNSVGAYAEANQWLEKGLAKWPYHGELVMTKVKLLFAEYRYQEALTMLKRLIAVKNEMAEPHIWIAMCYQKLGDNMTALAEAQLATRLAPKSYTTHKVLGDILKAQKKLSQANAAYEVAEMMRQPQQRR